MGGRIACVDLAAEYREVGPAVEDAVLRVLRSGRYVLGPEVAAFEEAFAERVGARFSVGVGSGTEALALALRGVGVGPGDEVVTPAFTYFATVEAILLAGARPVFADIEPGRFTLDPAAFEAAAGPRTRAVLPVHLFGGVADMAAICAAARARGIAVVEDAAQAVGSRRDGRGAGAWGDAGCFSFYPTKNLSAAGDGGCITTSSEELAERLRLLRSHGCRERDVHLLPGTTSRLDTLQAAVLLAKLPYLKEWTAARTRIAARYTDALSGCDSVELPRIAPDEEPVWHQYTIRCRNAPAVRAALDAAAIEWRHFYPTPAYRQPALAGPEAAASPGSAPAFVQAPETERACAEVLSLPIHPWLAPEDAERVADVVRQAAQD